MYFFVLLNESCIGVQHLSFIFNWGYFISNNILFVLLKSVRNRFQDCPSGFLGPDEINLMWIFHLPFRLAHAKIWHVQDLANFSIWDYKSSLIQNANVNNEFIAGFFNINVKYMKLSGHNRITKSGKKNFCPGWEKLSNYFVSSN